MGLDMRTSLEHAKTVKITNGASAVDAGDVVAVGDIFGVVVEDTDANATAVVIYQAEKIVLPKATGTGTIAVGEKVYHDATNENITNVSTDNTLVGICTVAAADADTTIEIDFDPMSYL